MRSADKLFLPSEVLGCHSCDMGYNTRFFVLAALISGYWEELL